MNFKKIVLIQILLSFFVLSPVLALDFTIKPIRIYISPGQSNIAIMEITNLSNKQIKIETEAKKWNLAKNGDFILMDTDDLIVVPPFIELQPKQKQLIKIAFLGEFDEYIQKSYRVIFKQLPSDIEIEDEPGKIKTAIQIILHMSIPVFVNPITKDLKYDLTFSPESSSDREVKILAKNTGNAFTRVIKAILYRNNKEIESIDMAVYILPNSEVSISIKPVNGKAFKSKPDKVKLILEDENEINITL